jgi:hypothetical protein
MIPPVLQPRHTTTQNGCAGDQIRSGKERGLPVRGGAMARERATVDALKAGVSSCLDSTTKAVRNAADVPTAAVMKADGAGSGSGGSAS